MNAGAAFALHDAHVRAWELHTGRRAADVNTEPDGVEARAEREAIEGEGSEHVPTSAEVLEQLNRELGPIHPASYDQAAAMRRTAAKFVRTGVEARAERAPARTVVEWPVPLNLAALAERAPAKPQFILADWMPAGYATLLAGHGGVGKSAIGLHLAVCVAMGLPFFGIATERRRVLYLSCEDRESVLHWRLAHICAYLGLNMAELAGRLDVLDLVGHDTVLWERDPQTGYTVTLALTQLAQHIEYRHTQLLVVDGISDAFGGNENARTEVKRFVNALLGLIPIDGSLLLLGHVSKPTATNGSTPEGYSGSTQWHNAVRARWYLYPETELGEDNRPARTGRLLLELQKSNLGPIDQSIRFQWDDDARMFVASGTFGTSAVDRKQRDETEQLGIVRALAGCAASAPPIDVPAATRGERTAFHVLSKRPEFPESLMRSTRRFWSRIEELRQLHLIEEQENRRSSRKRTWHFVLTAEGCARCASYMN